VEADWIEIRLLDGEDRGPWTGEDPDREMRIAVRDEPVSLRWILLHLIEETARHNGHLDILRELTDGATGR
jgi:hypothetical protein